MTNYEDKFKDVMKYATLKVPNKKKISNQEDLYRYLKNVDENRRDKKGDPRFSESFLQSIINTRTADKVIRQGSVGYFGKAERVQSARVERYRQEGKELHSYEGKRLAVKSSYQRNNNTIVLFRDVDTGRFVSKQRIR